MAIKQQEALSKATDKHEKGNELKSHVAIDQDSVSPSEKSFPTEEENSALPCTETSDH